MVSFLTYGVKSILCLRVSQSHVWGLLFLRLGVSQSYLLGVSQCHLLAVSFLTFGG